MENRTSKNNGVMYPCTQNVDVNFTLELTLYWCNRLQVISDFLFEVPSLLVKLLLPHWTVAFVRPFFYDLNGAFGLLQFSFAVLKSN